MVGPEVIDGRLRLFHGVDPNREERGRPVRGAADRVLAGAGRKNALLVLDDADAESRRRRGPGLLLQRRSAVFAAERIFVADPYARFTAAFVAYPGVAAGHRHDYGDHMAGLMNAAQPDRVNATSRCAGEGSSV